MPEVIKLGTPKNFSPEAFGRVWIPVTLKGGQAKIGQARLVKVKGLDELIQLGRVGFKSQILAHQERASDRAAVIYSASLIGGLAPGELTGKELADVGQIVSGRLKQLGIFFGEEKKGLEVKTLAESLQRSGIPEWLSLAKPDHCILREKELSAVGWSPLASDPNERKSEVVVPLVVGRLADKTAFQPVSAQGLVKDFFEQVPKEPKDFSVNHSVYELARAYGEVAPVAGIRRYDFAEVGYLLGLAAQNERFGGQNFTDAGFDFILQGKGYLNITGFAELDAFFAGAALGVFSQNQENERIRFLSTLCFGLPEGAPLRGPRLFSRTLDKLLGFDVFKEK